VSRISIYGDPAGYRGGVMVLDDRDAVDRLKRGDISGLETLVQRYQLRAVRTAYLITRDRALALDVVQAAFVKVYERISQFDAQRPFGPWFLKSVLNAAVKAAVARDRQVSLDTVAENSATRVSSSAASPEVLWEEASTAKAVWEALGALPPTQRMAIVQRYYLGYSEAEMAEKLGCPEGTVKSRLYHARARLRVLLQPLYGGSL